MIMCGVCERVCNSLQTVVSCPQQSVQSVRPFHCYYPFSVLCSSLAIMLSACAYNKHTSDARAARSCSRRYQTTTTDFALQQPTSRCLLLTSHSNIRSHSPRRRASLSAFFAHCTHFTVPFLSHSPQLSCRSFRAVHSNASTLTFY